MRAIVAWECENEACVAHGVILTDRLPPTPVYVAGIMASGKQKNEREKKWEMTISLRNVIASREAY